MQLFYLAALLYSASVANGFQTRPLVTESRSTNGARSTGLCMVKKMRNKQAELLKKMAEAKEQKAQSDMGGGERLSDKKIKEQNDRRRFEEMLKKQTASLNDVSSDGYLSKEQEEAEIDAYQRGLDRLFEGDPAPTQPFEELVNIKSENAIGDTGMRRLVPWLKNTKSDFLIILCDPRVQSPELREAADSLSKGLGKDLLSKLIIINADTPAENRRWLKKSNLEVTVYSDEKREWMRSYTALGENRWSMSMIIIADERLQKIAREMESISAVKVVQNAVKSMQERRL